MAQDSAAARPSTSTSAATSSSAQAPSNAHALRRARTFDDPAQRRLSPLRAPRRSSSNFSDYSLGEARDFLNPKADDAHDAPHHESSSLAGLALAFALLPAIAGALFKDGSAVVTDIMLLGLAGIFLHWSVTQPW